MAKQSILNLLSSIFILTGIYSVSAQTLVFDVHTKDNQSVLNPFFKLNGATIELEPIDGLYYLDSIMYNDELEIFAQDFVSFKYLITAQNKDSIFEIFTLFPKVQEINEVTVRAQNIQKIDGPENVHIVDYFPDMNSFWSIHKIRGNYYLFYNSITAKDSVFIETKAVELRQDCNSLFFLITDKGTFQLSYNQMIELKNVGDKTFFEQKIQPLVAIEDTTIYIESFSIHNQNYTVSSFDKNLSATNYIHIFDKVAAKVAQSRYNEIIAVYYNTASPVENVIANGVWSGNLIELCINHRLNAMITWYLKIRARPIECHSFGMLDNLVTIDLRNNELFLLDYSSKAVTNLPLPAFEGKVTEVIRDYSYDRIYFIIQGKYKKLYRFDYSSNELAYIKDLQPLGTIENIKILGPDLYFLAMTASSYDKLYKVKITL